jgi:hypothetical protein
MISDITVIDDDDDDVVPSKCHVGISHVHNKSSSTSTLTVSSNVQVLGHLKTILILILGFAMFNVSQTNNNLK